MIQFLAKFSLFVFLSLMPFIGSSQQCLQLLDSAQLMMKANAVITTKVANKLKALLDSGVCKDQIGYPEAYSSLGSVYMSLNQQSNAIASLKSALDLKLKEADSTSIELVPFYENLFSIHKDVGNYRTAGNYLVKSSELVGKTNSPLAYFNHLMRTIIFYRETGQYDLSEKFLAEAESYREEFFSDNDSIKGVLLVESGTLHTIDGRYEKANEDLERAVQILRSSFPMIHTRAVDRLAKLKYKEGDFTTSEVELLSNINFKETHFPDDTLLLVESLNNLGLLYFRINDLDNAKKYFQLLKKVGNNYNIIEPYALNNLGVISMRQGDFQNAKSNFQECLVLFKQTFGTLHPDYSNTLNNLAGLTLAEGNPQRALSYYTQVLDSDRVLYGTNHINYATTLSNVSRVYKLLGYTDMSTRLLNESSVIKRKVLGSQHHLYAESIKELGVNLLAKGDTMRALTYFDSALQIDVRHMYDVFPVLTDRQRTLFYNDIRIDLQRFSSVSFSENYFNTVWAEKALNFNINTKSALFYTSDKLRLLVTNSYDTKLRNKYILWREKKFELARAYLMTSAERNRLGLEITGLEEETQQLEKEIGLSVGAFKDQVENTFYSWEDISNALPDSTALLEILEFKDFELRGDSALSQGFVDESRYVGFIIWPDGRLQRISWPTGFDFTKFYKNYKNSLLFRVEDNTTYRAFWQAIDQKLEGIEKLYYAPDGIWHKMNPSIFYNPAKMEYVADKYHTVVITSGKDIIENEESNYYQTATTIGNPDFSKNPAEIRLNQLPQAADEARDVSYILGTNGWETDTLIFDLATESRVKSISRQGILHIATHGYFSSVIEDNNPLLNSGIVLSKGGSDQDGLLTAFEVINLNLEGTKLVVLSACETGLGEVRNGEGVFGLQRAFLVAGASHLVLSLLKVGDLETREFMNLFYSYLVDEPDVDKAFFEARAAYRTIYPDPKEWGSFILVSKK
ncbi:CHAT domain-containing protein [Ekhidna lutea]|uniref:CHAT domain-containing protein n=1 Tax=Ekhidna lutea TaxID=447679 RepID=UPI001180493A|nr:CHAT domain-containing protein [Ekhidna lutea]